MAEAIATRGLGRSFGDVVALRPTTLAVARGEVFGLLGSNGAGKTTTVRILTTLLAPTCGSASVVGHDVVAEADAVRRAIGVVSDGVELWRDLTVEENARFLARLHGLRGAELDERVRGAVARVGLSDVADRRVGALSLGLRKRAEIAAALVHGPRVLLLDEATTGVDPPSVVRIREIVLDLAREGVTVVWTSHDLEQAQRICRRVAIMSRGEVKAVGTPRELAALVAKEKTVEVRAEGGPERLRLLAGVLRRHGLPATVADAEGGLVRAVVDRDFDVGRVADVARSFGFVHAINTVEPSLEDVFLHYTA